MNRSLLLLISSLIITHTLCAMERLSTNDIDLLRVANKEWFSTIKPDETLPAPVSPCQCNKQAYERIYYHEAIVYYYLFMEQERSKQNKHSPNSQLPGENQHLLFGPVCPGIVPLTAAIIEERRKNHAPTTNLFERRRVEQAYQRRCCFFANI